MGGLRCESRIFRKSVSTNLPLRMRQLIRVPASLPLIRPILRSFGGIFSGARSDGSPSGPNSYANAYSVPTVGSAPKKRRSRPLTTTLDTESMIELAGEVDGDQGKRTSRAHVMHACDGDEGREEAVRDGIHVRRETRVDFGNV